MQAAISRRLQPSQVDAWWLGRATGLYGSMKRDLDARCTADSGKSKS
jgi:hypothetical protein